jgi:CheY-like chemotaxis protein
MVFFQPTPKSGQGDTRANPAPRALCVDDSPTCLATISAVVRRVGLAPVSATNGPDALARFHASLSDGLPAPAMVVTDFDMPEMNGVELARALCAAGFSGPIVFFTASQPDHIRRECLLAGILPLAIVAKPDLRALIAALSPAVESTRVG